MWNFLSGLLLIMFGFRLLTSGDLFLSIIGFFVLYFGIKNINDAFTPTTVYGRRRPQERERTQYYRQRIFSDDYDLSLVYELRKQFLYQSPTNVLAAILASVSIHIAKVDGHVSQAEVDALKYQISNKFNSLDHNFINSIVSRTKEHINSIGKRNILQSSIDIISLYFEILDNIASRDREYLSTLIFSILYEVAIADDGTASFEEEDLFNNICYHFQIPLDVLEQIKRTATYNYNVRQNSRYSRTSVESSKFKESIDLFNLSPNYTSEELEKAWKKFIMMYHPDRHHTSDQEVYKMMNQKFLDAQEVYNYLKGFVNKPRPK